MIIKQVFFEGRVQGVGFRYTTKRIAKGFDVTGWVRNLADGRVELKAMGESTEVAEFLQELQTSDLAHHIKNTQIFESDAVDDAAGFNIR